MKNLHYVLPIKLLLAISSFNSLGQSDLDLTLGLSTHPQNFFFGSAIPVSDDYEFKPMYHANVGLKNFRSRSWFTELNLIFRHTSISREMNFSGVSDPSLPKDGLFTYSLNYAGFQAGGGYRLQLSRSQQISTSTGVQSWIGLASTWSSENGDFSSPVFKGAGFASRFHYGLYIKPAYQFRLSRHAGNPWEMKVFLSGDMLFRTSEFVPIFLWGGGLGVNYRL